MMAAVMAATMVCVESGSGLSAVATAPTAVPSERPLGRLADPPPVGDKETWEARRFLERFAIEWALR